MRPFRRDVHGTGPGFAIQRAFRFCGAKRRKKLEKHVRAYNGRAFAPDSGALEQESEAKQRRIMKFRKRLQNPFVLVGQGFVLGGILFFATHPESLLASPAAAPSAESVIAALATGR